MARRLGWLDRVRAAIAPRAAAPPPARGSGKRAYDGAAVGRRVDSWLTPSSSADSEIARGLVRLRNRSRDLTRNNPHARKAVSVWANNLVGSGIVPRARTGNQATDAEVNRLWDEWVRVADADGQLDFYGLQELMVRTMVEGGEVLARRRLRSPAHGLPVPLQIQVLEGDLLDESRSRVLPNGMIVNGVEFDLIGRRRAYWLFPSHPGNAALLPFGRTGFVSAPIDADQLVHLYRKERTQTRGLPWSAAVVMRLRDLDDYEDAEIVRKKTEACVVAIVMGADADAGIAPTSSDGNALAVKDAAGNPIERFEPGLIAYSDGGKTIQFNNPSQSGSYPEIQRLGQHSIAAGYLLPYELLTGDLSQVNFSSARVGLVEFRRLVEAVQWQCLIPMALQPIWDWFTDAAFTVSKIPGDARRIPVEWDTPAFESVNPIDDANAELIRLRSGTLTLNEAIARRTGRNPSDVLAEIAETNAALDRLGLILDSDPRRTSRAGTEQPQGESQRPPPAPAGRGNLREVA